MCLMLYVGTAGELPLARSDALSVESIGESGAGVKRWFTQNNVRFVGAPTGCSCGFPYVVAESPIEYYDGLFGESEGRMEKLRSARALVDLVREASIHSDTVELYPVWNGEESLPPKGVIEWRVDSLDADRLVFTERFMYVVRRGDR